MRGLLRAMRTPHERRRKFLLKRLLSGKSTIPAAANAAAKK
jgi:hypothetical protein